MKIALLVAVLYAVLFTIGVFSIERPRTAALKVEREQEERHEDAMKLAPEWRQVTSREDRLHTLFTRAHVEAALRGTAKRGREQPPRLQNPAGLMTVSVVSACNPRINPCF